MAKLGGEKKKASSQAAKIMAALRQPARKPNGESISVSTNKISGKNSWRMQLKASA
jgi:hypothetical protein